MSKRKSGAMEQGAIKQAVGLLVDASKLEGRNLQMPGDGRYQPDQLKPFLGYDQWAGWLVIVEWFWLKTLAKIKVIPKEEARLLTHDVLYTLLMRITTAAQDFQEKITKHDILALLILMRQYLPKELHRWLHFCATSYDIICTAYALQAKTVFEQVFMPELREVDSLWREKIVVNANVIQAGRTHLQTALPITFGFWLAVLHSRFVNTSRRALSLSREIPGKFTGAVGTSAAQRALIINKHGERVLMEMLGLPVAELSTQITPPEGMARFYFELLLLSGALANLGEDARILQSSQFGEIISASSTSSTMSHKRSNPIAAEQMAGMHLSVTSEFGKVLGTLVSDLGRDLRWSNVMRSQSAMMVYVFQQILTTKRFFKSLAVDMGQCEANFDRDKYLVVAELLHLALQRGGVDDAHSLMNKIIVPLAREKGCNLAEAMEQHLVAQKSNYVPEIAALEVAWKDVSMELSDIFVNPETYLGDAIVIANREAKNKL